MKNETTTNSNPFSFDAATNEANPGVRKIEYTSSLIALSNVKATEIIRLASQNPELRELAIKVQDEGQAQDVFELITKVVGEEQIELDAAVLDGASDDVLDRLLESRRSDRSKAKAKGLKTNMNVVLTFFSASYAEMLVRKASKKPYEASSSQLDESDRDAITRKIKSLQSKQSRLLPLAKYDADKKSELDEVQSEIARLNSLRGTTVKTSSAIKSEDLTVIRDALKDVDMSGMSADDKARFEALMAKLG